MRWNLPAHATCRWNIPEKEQFPKSLYINRFPDSREPHPSLGRKHHTRSEVAYAGLTVPVILTSENYVDVSETVIENQSPTGLSNIGYGINTSKIRATIKAGIGGAPSLATETYNGNISGSVTFTGDAPSRGIPFFIIGQEREQRSTATFPNRLCFSFPKYSGGERFPAGGRYELIMDANPATLHLRDGYEPAKGNIRQ